jgi:hypothetical protein
MIKIIYSGKNTEKTKKDVLKAYNFVAKIFPVNISNITVRVHATRADYDKKLKRKSPDWEIADVSIKNEINVLSPFAIEKESPHPKNEFIPVLKHEFTHKFNAKLSGGLDWKSIPRWLDEGLAQCVAKQDKRSSVKSENIHLGFSKELAMETGWFKKINSSYDISSLFVRFLIRKYSIEKIKELISSLDRIYNYSRFEKTFFRVYGKKLSEVEELFITSLNKK